MDKSDDLSSANASLMPTAREEKHTRGAGFCGWRDMYAHQVYLLQLLPKGQQSFVCMKELQGCRSKQSLAMM